MVFTNGDGDFEIGVRHFEGNGFHELRAGGSKECGVLIDTSYMKSVYVKNITNPNTETSDKI